MQKFNSDVTKMRFHGSCECSDIKKYYVMEVAVVTKIRQDADSELYYGDEC